jgi:xanthine dehydrogenase molybdopterin-binding subunit B
MTALMIFKELESTSEYQCRQKQQTFTSSDPGQSKRDLGITSIQCQAVGLKALTSDRLNEGQAYFHILTDGELLPSHLAIKKDEPLQIADVATGTGYVSSC